MRIPRNQMLEPSPRRITVETARVWLGLPRRASLLQLGRALRGGDRFAAFAVFLGARPFRDSVARIVAAHPNAAIVTDGSVLRDLQAGLPRSLVRALHGSETRVLGDSGGAHSLLDSEPELLELARAELPGPLRVVHCVEDPRRALGAVSREAYLRRLRATIVARSQVFEGELLEVHRPDLEEQPDAVLAGIGAFVSLADDRFWLVDGARTVRAAAESAPSHAPDSQREIARALADVPFMQRYLPRCPE